MRPDPKHNNLVVAKFINHLMLGGQKSTARKVLYGAFDNVKKGEPIDVFMTALRNVSPKMELKSKRIGGANYQIPKEVPPERAVTLAMRWIIKAARDRKGTNMSERLAQEFMDAASEQGAAFKKKIDTHKMADANKAFAHFAR